MANAISERVLRPYSEWLPLDVSIDGEHLVVALRGEIDAGNAHVLPTAVAAAVNGDRSVRIDLSDVTFLDSSCLRAILMSEAMLAPEGVTLKVRNVPASSYQTFAIAGLLYLIE